MNNIKNIFFIMLVVMASYAWAGQELYAPQTPGAVSVTLGGPVIQELALKDVDISQAIEVIAQKSGLNIISGQNVKGRVTVFLKRVGAREALRIVLESNGLAYAEEDGIIRVMTADEYMLKYGYAFGQDKTSKLIKLNFVAARDVHKMLEEVKSSQGKVVVNEEARTVLLMDSPDKMRAMERLLADVDVPIMTSIIVLRNVRADSLVPEIRRLLTQSIGMVEANTKDNNIVVTDTPARVERVRKAVEAIDGRGRVMILEAKLVHVVLNDEHRSGIDWSGIVEDYQRVRLMGRYDFLAGGDNGRALGLGMIAKGDFATLIEALDTVGFVQEYPLSTIRVTGDEKVRMVVRLDDPSIDMSLVGPQEADGLQNALPVPGAALEFMIKTGFDVAGDVQTTVAPQEAGPVVSRLTRPEHAAHANMLSAHEGYTAVMGGMIVTERTSAAHKIPLLGDLPLVGFAFRMDGTVRKEEFVVFLTPKSVSLSQILADEANSPSADGALMGEE